MPSMALGDRPGVLHVEHCMGTTFTLDIRDAGSWAEAVAEVVAELHRVEAVFSTYRPDSDLSRLRRGELHLDDVDPWVPEVLALCAAVQAETGGAFSALLPGGIDPSGLVKGWAIERAAGLLTRHGSRNHAVNGGGDMQLAGEPEPGEPWRVGISDPFDRTRILVTVSGRDVAVATSGVAERGAHIISPFTGKPADTGLASFTVVGPSLTRVDAYATAAFVMGRPGIDWLNRIDAHEGLAVATDGTLVTTRGFAALCR